MSFSMEMAEGCRAALESAPREYQYSKPRPPPNIRPVISIAEGKQQNMLVLRAKTEVGWFLVGALYLSEILFLRHLKGRPFNTYRGSWRCNS